MKILYLAPDPVPSPKGAGVRIARTIRTLGELGHDVSAFTPATGDGAALTSIPHWTVALSGSNFLKRMTTFRAAAAAWLEEQTADAVQFRSIWEGVPAARWARARGARVVFEAHGFPSIELPYHHPGLARDPGVIEKVIAEEQALLREADLVLTHSRTGRRYLLARGVPQDRIAVVPNTVDPTLFSPGGGLPTDGTTFRILYVGTLAPWQGLGTLLEALVRFRKVEPPVRLVAVGPVKRIWRHETRRLARRLRVSSMLELAGPTAQENLVPVLREAHICVAPMPADPRNALQGCCPIKVLEYMAVGRPILATRILPLLEILEDGASARLVEPGSPSALADGIAWMIANPEEREVLGRRAREEVLARWTPDRFRVWLADALADDTLLETPRRTRGGGSRR